MVNIKHGDDVAQRPDTIVEYSFQGWTGGATSIERYRPGKDVPLPILVASGEGGIFKIIVRADSGVPGAKYRVTVGDQSWFLTVSWLIPCRPTGAPGSVQGVTRDQIPDGHVWVASPAGGGSLVPMSAPPAKRKRR